MALALVGLSLLRAVRHRSLQVSTVLAAPVPVAPVLAGALASGAAVCSPATT